MAVQALIVKCVRFLSESGLYLREPLVKKHYKNRKFYSFGIVTNKYHTMQFFKDISYIIVSNRVEKYL